MIIYNLIKNHLDLLKIFMIKMFKKYNLIKIFYINIYIHG